MFIKKKQKSASMKNDSLMAIVVLQIIFYIF